QALDGLSLTDLAVLDRAEERKHLIQLHWPDPQVVQKVLREGPELLRHVDQPLQYRIRVHLEHPRCAPDTQAFGQTGDHPHDQLRSHALAVEEGPEGLENIAATHDAQQLSPGTAIGVAMGAEIPPAHSAPVGAVWIGADMVCGVDLAASPPC